MYKVFLVEDEIVVRESMRDNFNWEEHGFIYAGEAADGEMALPMIEEIQPHIVITDIRMPFMDGLALSRILRKNMPWLKIIILTGHNEFDYAKQAISIGVNEYILKPIGSDDLLEILNKAAAELQHEEAAREKLTRLDDLQKQQNDYLLSDFLNDLVIGALDAEVVIENASKLNIDIIAPFYSVLLLQAENTAAGAAGYSEFLKLDAIVEQLTANNDDVIGFKRNIRERVLLVKGQDGKEASNTCYQIGQALKSEAEDKTSCEIGISIGGVKERVSGIAESFKEACQTSDFSYIFGYNKIIGVEDTKLAGLSFPEILPFERDTVKLFLKQGQSDGLNGFMEREFNILSDLNASSFLYAFIYLNIIVEVSRFVSELDGEPDTVLAGYKQDLPDFDAVKTSEEFARQVKEVIKAALEFREQKKLNRYSTVISRAKDYINSNFARSDLSLTDVADEVNISSSHFSTIFSQESGGTFIEYLTGTRVGKAKELLSTTSMKSSEIAFEVGYNDSHYFSHIFKKATGMSPGQYRNGEIPV